MMRTHYCGAPRKRDIGEKIIACGWVQNRRDMGGIIFIDLKDREGVLQIVCDAGALTDMDFHTAETVRNQSVIQVSGTLAARSQDTFNPRIATGEVELRVTELSLLSTAQPLPFSLDEDITPAREELRLKYRYLDIRRPDMLKNLQFRHRVQRSAEDFLCEAGFLSVETPLLTKSTPEGARDYLVPSRVHPGEFYALPQSPQIFKQLLMVGGIDRYYQVARCFRDEDLRADRQPEFTQVDMEMSFVEQEDVLRHLETMFKRIYADVMDEEIAYEFPRLTYAQAMDVYGTDKPDLRFGFPIVDLTDRMRDCEFSVFRKACERGGVVRAINIEGGACFTRTEIEELTQLAIQNGAKGMAWIAVREDASINSILTKYFTDAEFNELLHEVHAKPGDFILFCADTLPVTRRVLGTLRLFIGERLGLRDKSKFQFLFVTDFPQFEYSDEEKRYVAMHHPFTMPYLEDMPYLTSDPPRVRAQAYDVVLNGTELGSGSIRIHRSDVQRHMFEALGFSESEIQERFGFMVNAFQYGTPPHGGFAFGLDRLVMLLLGADSLREVIAFPKLRDASCPMTDAPSAPDPAQLEVLGMRPGSAVSRIFPQTLRINAVDAPAHTPKKQGIDAAYVAKLARIRLSDEEMRQMPAQMQAIVGFADTLSAIDTQGIVTTDYSGIEVNALRGDRMDKSLPLGDVLGATQDISGGYFAVPRML